VKSGLRRLRNAASAGSQPPVPLSPNSYRRASMFDLGVGRQSKESQLRAYGMSGTVYAIVSLLQQSCASPAWHLYKKQPVDGRRRYTTGDMGADQRTEVVNHAAGALWAKPNLFHSGFAFREGSNQHLELTGETFWVADRDNALRVPTSLWFVNPARMEPVPSPDDYLVGWIYNGPNGEQVPLTLDQVIQEKLPDPVDQFRGTGPVAAIMPNIQQQRYATEYQRNLFLNSADAGGVIQVGDAANKVRWTDREFDDFTDRWRESHQGIANAGRVGILENGATWIPSGQSNKDLEYGNLRLANRDEIREAWRMHKHMLGTVDDVNRANAETAEDMFTADLVLPRLERRKDTLNCWLLPMFGSTGQGVEFDYDDPSSVNQEAANAELLAKSQAAAALVDAGYDPSDVLEAVGLPDMAVVEKAVQAPALPPAWVPEAPALPSAAPAQGADPDDVSNYLKYLSGLNGHAYAGSQR
jgi:HK97 family phage portal protein